MPTTDEARRPVATAGTDPVPIGQLPGIGEVPTKMTAGINYNNVWAAQGYPVDQIAIRKKRGEPEDFHIGGSDLGGTVHAVREEVQGVEAGDHVVTHPRCWDADDPWLLAARDPMIALPARIWRYITNYGAFGQFAQVQGHQVLPKAPHLSWEEAAAPTLLGATAYRTPDVANGPNP